jgi:hypothetical protein
MESIKQALEGTQGDEVVRLRRAVEQGDHNAIDGGRALAHLERLTRDVGPIRFLEIAEEALTYLSRPQRLALCELLQAHARYSDLSSPGLMQQGLQHPHEVGLALQALYVEDPDLVYQLLGSEFRDLPVMKLTLAALAATAATKQVRPPAAG